MIKSYVDESGTHGDADVVTVAAYAGRPKAWQEWSREWKVAKRPIKVFHAVDAANRAGEFEGWSLEERTELVKKFLPVIFISKNANQNKAPMRLLFGGKLEQMPLQAADTRIVEFAVRFKQ